MNNPIQYPTTRSPIILSGIYLPNELFRRIVEHMTIPDVLKSGITYSCKPIYNDIFSYLLSREVVTCDEIITEIRGIKDAYGQIAAHFQIYHSKYPNSFLDVVGKLIFKQALASKCIENRMFTHPLLTHFAVGIYQRAIQKQENQDPLLQPSKDMSSSFKLLDRTSEKINVKLNFITFWLKLLESNNVDLTTPLAAEVAKSLNLLFFAHSEVAQIGVYSGHFKASHQWVLSDTVQMHPQLAHLQTRSWTCLKSCVHSPNLPLKRELAISAGLLCLSQNPTIEELRSDALSILKILAFNKDAKIREHIASTLEYLNRLFIFNNLPDADKFLVREIFLSIQYAKQKTVSYIIDEIHEYEDFIAFVNKPKKSIRAHPPVNTPNPEEPALKRVKNEIPIHSPIPKNRQVDKENMTPRQTNRPAETTEPSKKRRHVENEQTPQKRFKKDHDTKKET